MGAIIRSLVMVVTLSIFTGLVYPLAMTGLAQVVFPSRANGSIIIKDGVPVGSALIGQAFTDARYFSSRPSAGGNDAANSGGTNYGVPALNCSSRSASWQSLYVRPMAGHLIKKCPAYW